MSRPSSESRRPPSSRPTRYGEDGFTRTETIVRRKSYGPPVSATSSGGRRFAASPSSASGFWSNEKMKYDFGLTSPSRLSVRADSSKAKPVRRRSSLSTASRGMCGNRAIRSSTRAVRALTTTTLSAELRGQARDAVGAGHADSRQREEAVARRGAPRAFDRRAEEACGAHGRDHARVVATGRVAEEGDRDVEDAPDPGPRPGNLVSQGGPAERRQVDVVDRMGVDLPALPDHQPNLTDGQLAVEQVPDGQVENARPVALGQERADAREILRVAVVEGDDDRPGRQRVAALPVGVDAAKRDGVVAVRVEPGELEREVLATDVQVRKRRAPRWRADHVVHQDRHRAVVRADGCRARRAGGD